MATHELGVVLQLPVQRSQHSIKPVCDDTLPNILQCLARFCCTCLRELSTVNIREEDSLGAISNRAILRGCPL